MLKDTLVPELRSLGNFNRIIWMQDHASPHFGATVRELLDETFHTWFGGRGNVEWHPRSPNLTPFDFAV